MRPFIITSLTLVILAGCNQSPSVEEPQLSQDQLSQDQASTQSGAPLTTQSSQAPLSPSSYNILMENEHYRRGNEYFKERKFFSPAGANATESFLAARRSFGSPQEGLEEALTEMEPYLIIAIEKAQSDRDRQEAIRLLNLLKIVNPKAPAIVRLEQQMYALEGVVALNPSLPSPAVADQDMANTPGILVNEASPQDQAPAQDIP